MRAFLHSDLVLSGGVLEDRALGSRYTLSRDSLWVMQLLLQEPSVGALARHISKCRNISDRAARQAVYTLFGQLAVFGGIALQVESYSLTQVWLRLRWRTRQSGTVWGFVKSIVRAYGAVTVVCTVAALPLKLIGHMPSAWVWLPVLLFASCAVHEAGHALVARWNNVRFVLLSCLGYVAVLYVKPTDRIVYQRIALWGPLGGAMWCGILAWLVPPLRVWLACGFMIHASSLLPGFSDGNTFWRLHEKR